MRLLDGGTVANQTALAGQVEFKVRGSELYGVLRNFSRVQKTLGKTTGIL